MAQTYCEGGFVDITSRRNGEHAIDTPYVHEAPGVCGGYPVIRNTRLPVRVVVELQRQGADSEEIARLYPTIGLERVQGALDFYAEHPTRVDEDIQRNDQAWKEIIEQNTSLQGRPWPD